MCSSITDRPNPIEPNSIETALPKKTDLAPNTVIGLSGNVTQLLNVNPELVSSHEMVLLSASDEPVGLILPVMLLDIGNAVVPSNKDTVLCENTPYIKDRVKGRDKENLVLPEDVKPFPKAAPRKGANRKRVRSAILTNSPIKNAL